METQEIVKMYNDRIYNTNEFKHPDDIIEFVKNRFGVKYINSLDVKIDYYFEEEEEIEYEVTKFKIKWDEISNPVIKDSRIYVEVPIIVLDSKPSRIPLSKFIELQEGIKTFESVLRLKEWLINTSKRFVKLKSNYTTINVDMFIDGSSIYRAIRLADLQRFTDKEFILSVDERDIDDVLGGLIVDLTNSSLDIYDNCLNFDIRLKGFKYPLDKAEGKWVDWNTMKVFEPIRSLSDVI